MKIKIDVPNPSPIDNGPLDDLFGRSQAISAAVSLFWKMRLASKAEVGTVEETKTGFTVEIIYEEVVLGKELDRSREIPHGRQA